MFRRLFLLVVLTLCTAAPLDAQRGHSSGVTDQPCDVIAPVTPLREVPEASGIARSRRTPGVFWVHNDSPDPVVYAIDSTGAIKGRARVTGATVTDWEDIATGPCPSGDCLYIADIGDNYSRRTMISIYRVAEPEVDAPATAPAERLDLTYPDGPHDAEALFIPPSGQLFIVTKTSPKATAIYRVPESARPGSPARLERVTGLPLTHVTGGSASGDWAALRTNHELFLYRAHELVTGTAAPITIDLRRLNEPQGEGVALAADGTVYLVGERGSGTFGKMKCDLPR